MAVWALGINHTTAPLDLRGRFAIAAHDLPPTLENLQSALGQQAETTIISTCNRTELYCAGEGIEVAQGIDWLAANGGVSVAELQSHSYTKHADQAARHVFRVAAGLDSMVLVWMPSPANLSAKAWLRSTVRLAITICAGLRAAKCVAVSSIISPAPTSSTLVRLKSSNNCPARRTAAADMLMLCSPISVSLRTSLATLKAR